MHPRMSTPVNPASDNRRRQLRRWIDKHFGGSQTEFIASTNDGDKQINQGELSGLLKTKAFGEKRARRLEAQAHMPALYLEQDSDSPFERKLAEPGDAHANRARPTGWPFTRVTLRRLHDLKRALGPHKGVEAIHDIDETLELAVQKWERRADAKKSTA